MRKIVNKETAAYALIEVAVACFSRGNIEIGSSDPISLALYLGFSQLLNDWKEQFCPENGQ